jgi:serine/threonine-protein kinase
VQRTQAEATTLDEFFRLLVENIPEEDERAEFLKKMNAFKKPAAPSARAAAASRVAAPAAAKPSFRPAAPRFSPESARHRRARLASYVGPLAKLLIKDAVGTSMNVKDLYAQLAAHIDSEDERKEFLASLPR